jgi:hypothetical protein
MGWLRQHKDSQQVRGITLVVGAGADFRVHVTAAEPWRSYEGPHRYASPDIAFAAADALTRHRLGGHKCGPECTGWVDVIDAKSEFCGSTLNHH